MGCVNSRLREEVVTAVIVKEEPGVKPTHENDVPHRDEVSEYSLRECSFIPSQTEVQRMKASEDPSIFKILQEIS